MQNYPVRTKYRIAIFLWFINAPALLLATLYLNQYFLIPLFAVFAIVGLYTLLLKCPRCGKKVLYNPINIFGTELWVWTSWIPKSCTQCGEKMP